VDGSDQKIALAGMSIAVGNGRNRTGRFGALACEQQTIVGGQKAGLPGSVSVWISAHDLLQSPTNYATNGWIEPPNRPYTAFGIRTNVMMEKNGVLRGM